MKKQKLPAKKFIAALLFSLASAMLFSACGKTGDKTDETNSDSTKLLTQKPWVVVKIEYRYDEHASWQEAPIPEC